MKDPLKEYLARMRITLRIEAEHPPRGGLIERGIMAIESAHRGV